MTGSTIRGILWLGVGVVQAAGAQPAPAHRHGKFVIAVSAGSSAFSGAARGIGDEGQALLFTPYRPTMGGVRLSYGRDRHRIELGARYGKPGLGLTGVGVNGVPTAPDVLLIVQHAYRLMDFSAGASTRLTRLGGGPALRAHVALTLERWSGSGLPPRVIAGGSSGLTMEVGLSEAFALRFEGEVGFTPGSPFPQWQLPEGFEPRRTWRRSLAAALAWRP